MKFHAYGPLLVFVYCCSRGPLFQQFQRLGLNQYHTAPANLWNNAASELQSFYQFSACTTLYLINTGGLSQADVSCLFVVIVMHSHVRLQTFKMVFKRES